ncbi:MAG: hypothetical protein ACOC9Z_00465 [Chloroflexota bacterium]
MTFFRALQGNPLFILFTLLSLAYFASGLRLAKSLWDRRQAFAQNPLQLWKKAWSERAAFLLAVPPGVFVHELFHALAIWGFGGAVVDVGYGFYWGYVSTPNTYTPAQDWFISLAGTLGTLLFGFALWLALRRSRSDAWRYFGLRALRFHLYYGLLYYPLFTLFTFIGDWRTIYNFEATPLLSSATLVVHVASLGLFWWTDRRGWYEMPTFQSAEEREQLKTLQEQAALNPQDQEAQLRLIETMRRSGATNDARRRLRQFLDQFPRSAQGHLVMGFLEAEGESQLPRSVRSHLEQALQLGLSDDGERSSAHALLGQYYLQVEKTGEALRHLDTALSGVHDRQPPQRTAQLHYLRALTQRRRGAYQAATEDIEKAISLARQAGSEQMITHYENERRTIAHHRGRG